MGSDLIEGVKAVAMTISKQNTLNNVIFATFISCLFLYFILAVFDMIYKLHNEENISLYLVFEGAVESFMKLIVFCVIFTIFMLIIIIISTYLLILIKAFNVYIIIVIIFGVHFFPEVSSAFLPVNESFSFRHGDCLVIEKGLRTPCGYNLLYKRLIYRASIAAMTAFVFYKIYKNRTCGAIDGK